MCRHVVVVLAVLLAGAVGATTFTVTNLNDTGAGSLRQATVDANAAAGPDVIVFQTGLSGTIQLLSPLAVTESVQILGPGASTLTVRRLSGGNYSVFHVNIVSGGAVTLSGLRINNGDSRTNSNRGGGLYVLQCNSVTVAGCVFDGNASGDGGGLWSSATNLVVTDCTFVGNVGGAFYASNTAEITNCTFTSNLGVGCHIVGTATLTNCTIDGNVAEPPGGGSTAGLYSNSSGTCTLRNCTVTNGSTQQFVTGHGGLRRAGTGAVVLINSVICDNYQDGMRSDLSGTFLSLGHNIVSTITGATISAVQGDLFGTTGTPVNVQLGALASNGGQTQTRMPLAGSPAINAATLVSAPLTDQRGQARLGAPDVGACEYTPSTPELDVFRGTVAIADGSTDNLTGSFGTGFASSITYAFRNSAGGTLTLSNPASVGNFSNCAVAIVVAPLSSLAGMQETTTTLEVTPAAAGNFSFTYSIANNDSDENPYNWTVAGVATAPAPEFDVFRAGAAVADSSSDNVGFGFGAGVAKTVNYDFFNTGTATLTLTNPATIGSLSNCSVGISVAPAPSVGPGGATFTRLSIQPTSIGAFSFTYSIANDDPNEAPYNWTVNGIASSSAPELDVSRGSAPIADGATDPLGNYATGSPVAITYTLLNSGTANLTIVVPGAVSMLQNCVVTIQQAPTTPVSPQASTQVIFEVTPTSAGPFSFRYQVANNDADESPYDFLAGGTAGVATAPELDLSRGATPVADGGTDSVTGALAGLTTVLTYEIANVGNANLSLSVPLAAPGALSNCTAVITTQPGSTVAASGTTTLVVSVTPTAAGAFSCTISITSDDADENPYNWTISGTAATPQPEMDVERASVPVADGSTDSLTSAVSGVPIVLTYTIFNTGAGNLVLTLPVAAPGSLTNCTASITSQPASPIVPTGSETVVVTVTPGTGSFSCTISITNNDPNENPYNWTISGTAIALAAEMDVARGATPVADGSTDTVTGAVAGTPEVLSYTIANNGNATLNLTVPVAAPGSLVNCTASVTTHPGATIGVGASDAFVVTVTPVGSGTFSCTISITNDDPDENPYNWTISGSAIVLAPELDLERSSTPVADGAVDTATGATAGIPIVLTYQLINSGTVNVVLTLPIAAPAGLTNCTASITTQPGSPISPAGSENLVITVTPSTPGSFSCTLTITSNDADENPYDWTISGTAAATSPEMDVERLANPVASGSTDTLTGGQAGLVLSLSYTIANNGTADLNISLPVAVPSAQANCSVTIVSQPGAVVAASASTVMVLSVIPTAPGSFSCVVSIDNDDPDENPYTWTIAGNAIAPQPEMGVSRSGNAVADGGTDSEGAVAAAVPLALVYTIENTGAGNLVLSGTPNRVVVTPVANVSTVSVTAQPASPVGPSASVSFQVSYTVTAAGSFSFTVSIANNDSNESPYNWTVSGVGSAGLPEIDAFRGATLVPSGTQDNISATTTGAPRVLAYTLSNNGTANLSLVGSPPVVITGQTNCSAVVSLQPGVSTLVPAASVAVEITVTPVSDGGFTFSFSIANDDSNENPYVVSVLGTGVPGGGGDEGGDDDGGCSSGSRHGQTMLVLLVVGAAFVVRRRRQTC